MSRHFRAAVLLMLPCLALPFAEANAQDPLRTYNKNPVVISAQIRLAMELEERAFELMPTATRSADDLQLTKDTVNEAYKMIRFALGGVNRARHHDKFPDPTLGLQNDLMEKARTKARFCITELNRVGTGSVERLQGAHKLLAESYQTLQTLQALLP